MKAIRTVMMPVDKMCHIEFYVWADPLDGGMGFCGGNPFVLEGAYFETREEAEALMEKHRADWCEFEIRERITPVED